MRVVREATFLVALVAWSAVPAFAARELTLYDVDFGSPPHVLGSEPVFAAGLPPRDTPSDSIINLATATVVATSNGLTDRPVELATGACAGSCISSLVFDIFDTFDPKLPDFEVYTLTGTLVLDPTETTGNGGAAVFADVFSQGFVLRFLADGSIWAGRPAFEVSVGTHTVGDPISFEVVVDVALGEWTVSVDGVPLYGEPIPDAPLDRFRVLAYANGAIMPGSKSLAATDDLWIRAGPIEEIPALGATGLVMLAGVFALLGQKALKTV